MLLNRFLDFYVDNRVNFLESVVVIAFLFLYFEQKSDRTLEDLDKKSVMVCTIVILLIDNLFQSVVERLFSMFGNSPNLKINNTDFKELLFYCVRAVA